MLRKLSIILGLALTASLFLAATPPAQAGSGWVNTGKSCNWQKYKSHWTVAVSSKAPALTHVRTHAIPPTSGRTYRKTASHNTTLRAAATYSNSTSVGVTGAAKIIAKAEAQVNFGLEASGSHTTSKSVTVSEYIRNRTRKNASYVFFRGWTKVAGSFRYYFCEESKRRVWTVHYKPGKWRSYGVFGDGAVRCGAGGTLNSLQRAALRVGCA